MWRWGSDTASDPVGAAARLQRAAIALLIAAGAVWGAWWWSRGHPWLAVVGGLAISLLHAAVMAAELTAAHLVNRADPVGPAAAGATFRAWWHEALLAVRVFGWRQPFCSRDESDHLPAQSAGRRGVVLVHGFACNRGFWNPWMRDLRARGVPFTAVELEPVFGAIDEYARTVGEGVERVARCTGAPPLVVAHSMGGLAVRAWLCATEGADDRVAHVVTIGTPHHGTWLGRFSRASNGRQMRLSSRWLAQLCEREPATRAARFTCFYSHCDNVVFPASSATLPGADNRHVPGPAHVELAGHPAVFDEVLRRLDARPQAGG